VVEEKQNSLILYLGQKWAPIEMNGKHCNLETKKNKTPGDSKVTSSLGFSSKNLLECTEAYCIHLKKKNLLCFSDLTS